MSARRSSAQSGAALPPIIAAVAAAVMLGTGLRAGSAGSPDHPTRIDGTRVASEAEVAATRHLLARATYGVRASDLERALLIGRTAWLDEQLASSRGIDPELDARLSLFPAADMGQSELYERYPPPQVLRRQLERSNDEAASPGGEDGERELGDAARRAEMRERGIQPPGRILFDLVGAKLQRAVYSERQLEEVMTDFWFNHFNVFFGKGADRWLVGAYEKEAIRPHVFGRFEDMLIATASHPAMLFYLDNWQNVAPADVRPRDRGAEMFRRLGPTQRRRALARRGLDDAQIERLEEAMRRGDERGINENYARELLELHTLGVDGGYTQDDVVEVARVFTGWSIVREGQEGRRGMMRGRPTQGPVERRFRPELHDPGDKQVLGAHIEGREGGAGEDEAVEVMTMLAQHPSTARFLATKLAIAFAADAPPPALVAELETVFLETGGDLREVTRALFSSDHFYDPVLYDSKVKSPFQLVASTLRVTGARVGPSRPLMQTLQEMGELPYMSVEPTGYPAASEDWTSSGAVLQRVNFALAVAEGGMRGVRTPTHDPDRSVSDAVAGVLPGLESQALTAAIEAETAGATDAGVRVLGLALGSPQFQRR